VDGTHAEVGAQAAARANGRVASACRERRRPALAGIQRTSRTCVSASPRARAPACKRTQHLPRRCVQADVCQPGVRWASLHAAHPRSALGRRHFTPGRVGSALVCIVICCRHARLHGPALRHRGAQLPLCPPGWAAHPHLPRQRAVRQGAQATRRQRRRCGSRDAEGLREHAITRGGEEAERLSGEAGPERGQRRCGQARQCA
jgi:hypothetical protein